jgi:hypothetical protein
VYRPERAHRNASKADVTFHVKDVLPRAGRVVEARQVNRSSGAGPSIANVMNSKVMPGMAKGQMQNEHR